MAMICKKCGGIIPDIMLNREDRNDCKNHTKPEINVESPKQIISDSK